MEAVVSTRSSLENAVIARQSCAALLLLLLLPLLVLGAQEKCSGGRASWRPGQWGSRGWCVARQGRVMGGVYARSTYSLVIKQV